MTTKGECILHEEDQETIRSFMDDKLKESLEKIKTNTGYIFDETGIIKKKWTDK